MTILDFMYVLGIFQGTCLASILIFVNSPNYRANRFMGALIFVVVLSLAYNWSLETHYILSIPFIAMNYIPLDYLVGPLLYLYGKSFIRTPISKEDLVHFIIPVIATLFVVVFSFYGSEGQLALANYMVHREESFESFQLSIAALITDLQGFAFVLHLGFYCALLHKLISREREKVSNEQSIIDMNELSWLKKINQSVLIFITFFVVFSSLPELGLIPLESANFAPNVAIVLIIQFTALISLWRPDIIHGNITLGKADVPVSLQHKETSMETDASNEESAEKNKYKRSGLSSELAQSHRLALINIMEEEKLFLDCELTLNDLAKELDIPAHQLSEVLNETMNLNFYSFVNGYRVKYSKDLLSSPEHAHKSVIELAFEAGFRSKSSFYETFKKATDMTPTQYKKLNLDA